MSVPPTLHPGDVVRVVAPSGPFDAELLEQGLARLDRFDVRIPGGLMGRQTGFFAGEDETRLQELQEALDCSEAKAVWVARGGYGLARIGPRLNWERFKKYPKWVVGFSDTTTLLREVGDQGLVSLHAANGTTLSRLPDEEFRETISILEGHTAQDFAGLDCVYPGVAEGSLFGGNLTVLFADAAAGRLKVPEGAVLFLEDVTETSYRIDRMLNALHLGGHLARVSGIVLGEFLNCSPGKFEVPTSQVLERELTQLGIPVATALPVGHGAQNRPLIMGAQTQLDATAGRMQLRLPSETLGA